MLFLGVRPKVDMRRIVKPSLDPAKESGALKRGYESNS